MFQDAIAALTLYGAAHSGSVAVEAALTLLGLPYRVVEGPTWHSSEARERVGARNAMRQIPTLVFPDGETMTESAAILLWLGDAYPVAGLAPLPDAGAPRRQYLRWISFVASSIYALHWIKPDVGRIGAPAASREAVVEAVHERIAFCWRTMDEQLRPGIGPWLLGERLTMLDLYVAVVSRFGPWRERFAAEAPAMAAVIDRVDAEPRLAALWRARFPEGEG